MMYCANCNSPDVRMRINMRDSDRPSFHCYGCTASWTYGKNGGEWAEYVQVRENKRKSHEPHYIYDYGVKK